MPNPMPSTAPLLAHAARLLKAGRPGEAISSLQKAAALAPADAAIQHDLGLACLETGQLAEAAAAFRRAVVANPRYTDAYFRLGIALEKAGDARGAVMAYDRAHRFVQRHQLFGGRQVFDVQPGRRQLSKGV